MADWGHPAEAEFAVLLASKVAINAVVHAGPHPDGETLCLVLEQIGAIPDGTGNVVGSRYPSESYGSARGVASGSWPVSMRR